ncbi:MAG: hypothetical protein K9M17_05405, partial [Mariprofundaceae bacterium]|nr:hypothetical protein [Mariprofundaceae bacterium]
FINASDDPYNHNHHEHHGYNRTAGSDTLLRSAVHALCGAFRDLGLALPALLRFPAGWWDFGRWRIR